MSKKETFRPALSIEDIHQISTEERDPAYFYKYVSMDYRHDRQRVQRYLKLGWELVETTKTSIDDRSFAPKEKDDKLRPQPDIITSREGMQLILMRITHEKRAENELEKRKQRDAQSIQSVLSQGGKVMGNKTIGAEVNETNI